MAPLKNRKSKSTGTFDKIQKTLAEGGAKKVMFDYADDGTIEAISFAMEINGKLVGFKLPAMVDNVFQLLYGEKNKDGRYDHYIEAWKGQAYKTAWANIRDWIDAQIALVKTRQVEIAQVFLPYMVVQGDKTLYQQVMNDPKFMLGSGE